MQNRKTRIGYAALVCCLAIGMAYGASNGEKVKVQGMITGRTGESVTIKTNDGSTVTVVLDDNTKVQQPKGLGLRKKQMSATVLVPGLKISVDGTTPGCTALAVFSVPSSRRASCLANSRLASFERA